MALCYDVVVQVGAGCVPQDRFGVTAWWGGWQGGECERLFVSLASVNQDISRSTPCATNPHYLRMSQAHGPPCKSPRRVELKQRHRHHARANKLWNDDPLVPRCLYICCSCLRSSLLCEKSGRGASVNLSLMLTTIPKNLCTPHPQASLFPPSTLPLVLVITFVLSQA